MVKANGVAEATLCYTGDVLDPKKTKVSPRAVDMRTACRMPLCTRSFCLSLNPKNIITTLSPSPRAEVQAVHCHHAGTSGALIVYPLAVHRLRASVQGNAHKALPQPRDGSC